MNSVVAVVSFLLVAGVLVAHCAPVVVVDEELKEYNQSLEIAKQAIVEAKKTLKSDYVQNFASIMYAGVEELDKTTRAKLSKTTDKTERAKLIDYGTKAYKRLVVFLKEVKDSLE